MSLLGWVVGAALLDERGRREEHERELEERDRQIREQEGTHQPVGGDAGARRPRPVGVGQAVGAEGTVVMRLMKLRRGEFHLHGHEVVLRFVEEVHDADLVRALGDSEDEKVFADGGSVVALQLQNRVVAKRIALGHRPQVAQRRFRVVGKMRRRRRIAKLSLDVGESVAELLLGSRCENDLIHRVPPESRRAPQKRLVPFLRRSPFRLWRSLRKGLAWQRPCHRGQD